MQTLWKNLNERAHAGVVKVLEGKDLGRKGNISTANGAVTLDLRKPRDTVRVYDPTTGTAPMQTLHGVTSVPLTLSDHPVVIEL